MRCETEINNRVMYGLSYTKYMFLNFKMYLKKQRYKLN
jgi:hypothetical protein